MFWFETQSFFDFLNHVIRVFLLLLLLFCGGWGGGIIESWIVHCSMPFWKIIYCIYLFIYSFIYLFNSISYGIHHEGKEIQKNE